MSKGLSYQIHICKKKLNNVLIYLKSEASLRPAARRTRNPGGAQQNVRKARNRSARVRKGGPEIYVSLICILLLPCSYLTTSCFVQWQKEEVAVTFSRLALQSLLRRTSRGGKQRTVHAPNEEEINPPVFRRSSYNSKIQFLPRSVSIISFQWQAVLLKTGNSRLCSVSLLYVQVIYLFIILLLNWRLLRQVAARKLVLVEVTYNLFFIFVKTRRKAASIRLDLYLFVVLGY